jgi:hypothetical protein
MYAYEIKVTEIQTRRSTRLVIIAHLGPVVQLVATGHRVKRSRQDDETQYQYRKRKVEQERLQTPEETQQPDVRVEKALCVKSVMKKIMQLTNKDLKSQLNDMTLLMTAWCKSKFTMLCKHVIVYCG